MLTHKSSSPLNKSVSLDLKTEIKTCVPRYRCNVKQSFPTHIYTNCRELSELRIKVAQLTAQLDVKNKEVHTHARTHTHTHTTQLNVQLDTKNKEVVCVCVCVRVCIAHLDAQPDAKR